MYFLLLLFSLLPTALALLPPYGQLSVLGTNLKGSGGQNVALHGMSLFCSEPTCRFYKKEVIQALKCSWNTNIVRATMTVDPGRGTQGYLENPGFQTGVVNTVVQAAIDLGIYVLISWQTDITHQVAAEAFFTKIAQMYAGVPNVLYEIYNEPVHMSWVNELVPYHISIIQAIRKYDKKNIIVAGTPIWSLAVDTASKHPIKNETNIMYTLHYYAQTEKQELRDKAQTALNNGLPLFITEYGTTSADGHGSVDVQSSNDWWKFVDKNGISQINWSLSDKNEGSAALIPGTPATVTGVSSDANLTPSGKLVKAHYKAQNNGVSCQNTAANSKLSKKGLMPPHP